MLQLKLEKLIQLGINKLKNLKTFTFAFIDDSDLDGQGIQKIIFPCNIIGIHTRLDFLLELKRSGHTNTLTEA